jgi:hypothetical protein
VGRGFSQSAPAEEDFSLRFAVAVRFYRCMVQNEGLFEALCMESEGQSGPEEQGNE